MKSKLLFAAIVLLLSKKQSIGQDTIQLRNNSILIGLVHEISETELKYKRSDNPDGPLYTISKYEVEKVIYKNATVEKFEYVAPWRRKITPKAESYIKIDSAQTMNVNELIAQRIVTNAANNQSILLKSSIQVKRNYFSLNNVELKGRGLHKFLLAQNNPLIDKNVDKAKNYRRQSYLGFLAIPMAMAGGYYLLSDDNRNNSSESIKTNKQMGIAGLFAAALTVGYSIHINGLRTQHLQKAVDAYNETRTENRLENCILVDNPNKKNTSRVPPILVINSHQFIYQGEIKNEYQLQEIMLKQHDPVIQQKIEAARRGKLLRFIVFADIPLTVVGFGILADAIGRGLQEDAMIEKQLISSVFLVAGAACFTIGIYNGAAYKKNTQRAALRYNKLYNN